MAINVVAGPAYSGKTERVKRQMGPGDILIDSTMIWRALYDPPEGAVRTAEEAAVVQYAKAVVTRRVAESEDVTGWLTLASGSRDYLKRWMQKAGADNIIVYDEVPKDTLKARARKDSPECETIVDKWFDTYEEDVETDVPWGVVFDDEVRAMPTKRELRAAFLSNAEIRVEGGKRTVTGIAMRYGAPAMFGKDYKEVFTPGAFAGEIPEFNLTMQHRRELPVGIPTFQDSADALRFRCELAEGPRADQALYDLKAGMIRGASIEFYATDEKEEKEDDVWTRIVGGAELVGLSLVDQPAYEASTVAMRSAMGGHLGAAMAEVRAENKALQGQIDTLLKTIADLTGV